MKQEDELSTTIIGWAIEGHRHFGLGLLESAYEECLCPKFSTHKLYRHDV